MLRMLLIIFSFALSTQVVADADAESSIPMARLYDGYEKYLEKSVNDELALLPVYTLTSKEVEPSEIKLHFRYQNQEYAFGPEADGRLRFRPTADMLEANPVVFSNQPKGTLAITLSVDVAVVSKTRYKVSDLHDRVHQAWGEAKSFRGVLSVFAAKHSGLKVIFPESCTDKKWSVLKGQKVVVSGEDEAEFLLDFGDKKVRKADYVMLSCRPYRFSLN